MPNFIIPGIEARRKARFCIYRSILLGISPPSHTKEELEMYRNYSQEAVTIDGVTMSRYEWSQQQRRIETAVREQKHIAVGAKAAGDDVARREAQRNINRLQTQYAKISDAAGLTPEKERMAVAGFRKVKTADELKRPGAAVAERNTGKRVYYNSKSSYSVSLSGYDETVNRGLSDAARSVAQKGSKDGFEHMHLVDLANGEVVFHETNESFSSVGYAFREYIKSNSDRMFAFVHNHNTDGSFSEADLHTLLTTKQTPVMIAVRNDGVIYIAERDGDALQSGNFDALYEEDLKVLREMLKDGIITMSQRTRRREEIIVNNLLRDYTKGKGLIEYGNEP